MRCRVPSTLLCIHWIVNTVDFPAKRRNKLIVAFSLYRVLSMLGAIFLVLKKATNCYGGVCVLYYLCRNIHLLHYTYVPRLHCPKSNPKLRDITRNVEENEILNKIFCTSYFVLYLWKFDYLWDSVQYIAVNWERRVKRARKIELGFLSRLTLPNYQKHEDN